MSDYIDTDSYLVEKTLLSLQSAVQIVDLVNDPKTSRWYKEKLSGIAQSMVNRLVPIVVFASDCNHEALSPGEIQKILNGGSFAFKRWCRQWKIKDPAGTSVGAIRHLEPVDDDDEGSLESGATNFEGTEEEFLNLKLQVYASLVSTLLFKEFSEPARKMLLWLLRHLLNSEFPDTVSISKRFLPTDLGLSADEAADAYKFLSEQNIVEAVAPPESSEPVDDKLVLKLVLDGVNESREPVEFEEVVFGFPGSRINGEVTLGERLRVKLSPLAESRHRWSQTKEHDFSELKHKLQTVIGKDSIFVEDVELQEPEDGVEAHVRFRHPLSSDRTALFSKIEALVAEWFEIQESQFETT